VSDDDDVVPPVLIPVAGYAAPDRPLGEIGLSDALGLRRKPGLRALYRRVRRAAIKHAPRQGDPLHRPDLCARSRSVVAKD